MSRRRARGEAHSAMDGSLCDHPVRKLLDLCQGHRLTGVLHVTSWGRSGRVEIRAGEITASAFGTHQGHAATNELLALRDGLFELHQHLPSVEAAGQRGQRLPLSAVIEQCRTRALSCRVEVVSRKQRAVITYRAGELENLEVDGGLLPEGMDAGQVLAPFENGQVQVEALPLSLQDPASPEAVPAPAAPATQASARTVSRPADREDSRPARVSPAAAREGSQPNRAPAAPAAREGSQPNRVAPPPVPLAAREDSRPNRVAPPPVPLAAREDSRPNRVAPPPVPLAARQDSRPNRVAPPPVPLAAREDSRPNRVAPPPVPLAAREESRPNRAPAAPAARQDSRPNRAPAAPAARQDSRPNRAPAAPTGARPVPRPKVASVASATLQPVPLQPSSSSGSIPVALGRSHTDGSGAVSGVRPWFDNPDPSEVTATMRNAFSSRRELAVPALVTLLVVSLLLVIGFIALRP